MPFDRLFEPFLRPSRRRRLRAFRTGDFRDILRDFGGDLPAESNDQGGGSLHRAARAQKHKAIKKDKA